MEQHDSFTGECRDLSAKGLGVFNHPDGRVVFVAGAWPGDRAEVIVEKWDKRYGFGRVAKLEEPSPGRRKAPCPYQGYDDSSCGGCPWMIGNYKDQIKFKEQHVRHFVERAGYDVTPELFKPIIASPSEFGYRNRAQFKTDGKKLGFVAQDTKLVVDVADCQVLTKQNRKALAGLRKTLPNKDWQPTEKQTWNYIDIDEELAPGEFTINKRRPFQQANAPQNRFMQQWLTGKLYSQRKNQQVLELFCGSGNFTKIISAAGFKKIAAVEVGKPALKALEAKKIPGVTAHSFDLFKTEALDSLKKLVEPKILILDPPRAGFRLLEQYCKAFKQLTDIYYISCDISSLGNDIKALAKQGWRLKEVQPVDQFPHTPHVECLIHLTKDS